MNKKERAKLRKRKLEELNLMYRHERRLELALPFIVLPTFFILFFIIPIPWKNLSIFIPGSWMLLESFYIKKHSDYYHKRAAILPHIDKPSSARRFFIFGAGIIFAMGTIFFIIESLYTQTELEMYFEANQEKVVIIGLIVAIIVSIIVYFMSQSAPSRRVGAAKGPAEERKGGSS